MEQVLGSAVRLQPRSVLELGGQAAVKRRLRELAGGLVVPLLVGSFFLGYGGLVFGAHFLVMGAVLS